MFATLLESRPARTRSAGATLVSSLLHVVMIVGAVYATARGTETAPPPLDQLPAYIELPKVDEPLPDNSAARSPTSSTRAPANVPVPVFKPLTAPISIPTVLPAIDLTANVTRDITYGVRTNQTGIATNSAGSSTGNDDTPRWAFEVERMAQLAPNNPEPAYPSILKQTGQVGTVRMGFVVDTTGRAVMSSVKLLESSHSAFTTEVMRVLPRYRFIPAEVGGRKVSVHVIMPFEFRIVRE